MAIGDIEPGDVLLFHGHSFVSWAIRKFDGTKVNHTAIALDGALIGEAAGSGLRRSQLDHAIETNDFTIVRRLPGHDMAPVVAKANMYLNGPVPYAYQEIVLLAILVVTRKVPMPRLARRLVRSVLDHAAAALNAIVDDDPGVKTMICSEFVYRCYDEASDATPDPYALDVLNRKAVLAAGPVGNGDEGSFLDWARSQPQGAFEAATPIAAFPGLPAAGVGEGGTRELDALIRDYALTVDPTDPEILSMEAVAAGPPVEIEVPEPTDEDLLASMTRFSAALEQYQENSGPVAGIGESVAEGALRGLIRVSADPNFVTPGDLLMTPSLVDLGQLPQ